MKAVYKIFHIATKKVYIGSALSTRVRWNNHISLLRRGLHHSTHLQSAWDKYGEDSFKFEIIEIVGNSNDLVIKEQYWIDNYKSHNTKYGYNNCPKAGSALGRVLSEEHKRKISEAAKNRCNNPEFLLKMSHTAKKLWGNPEFIKKRKGWKHTEEFKSEQSIRSKKLWKEPKFIENMKIAQKEKPRSIETRNKMSESRRKLWNNVEYREKATNSMKVPKLPNKT
jgi:group I intron endonuclease